MASPDTNPRKPGRRSLFGRPLSPLWFGILFCMNMQISYISPPFGPAAFYLKGVAPAGITLTDIFRSIWPYMGLQIIALTLLIAFPQIALWLPSTMNK